MPLGRDEERGQMPHPWDHRLPTILQFFLLIIKITISSLVIGLKKVLVSTNSIAKLLSDSLLLDSLLLDSLLSDSSISQSYSKM